MSASAAHGRRCAGLRARGGGRLVCPYLPVERRLQRSVQPLQRARHRSSQVKGCARDSSEAIHQEEEYESKGPRLNDCYLMLPLQ